MIDTHCHLADRKFSRDLPAVIRRAGEAGVERMLCIADSIPESRACLRIAEKYEQIFCTVGVHPHNAKEWKADDARTLRALAESSNKVRAIGEIGLDYHYDHSPRDLQKSSLGIQLDLAAALRLPVVLHCREAIKDLRDCLRHRDPSTMVLHCCTEAWDDVEDLVRRGMHLSFTGIATYPQADAVRTAMERCPIGQMMVETDAPYLAPVPHRGKRNEPAFVVEVAKFMASLKGISPEEADRVTTENALAFFGLPA